MYIGHARSLHIFILTSLHCFSRSCQHYNVSITGNIIFLTLTQHIEIIILYICICMCNNLCITYVIRINRLSIPFIYGISDNIYRQ